MHVLITAPSWENFCALDWWQGFFSSLSRAFFGICQFCGRVSTKPSLWSCLTAILFPAWCEHRCFITNGCVLETDERWLSWRFQMGMELEASPLLLTPHGYRRGSIDIRWRSIPSWKQPHRILIWDWTSRLWGTELCAGALNKSSNSLSVNSTPRLCFPTWLSRTEAFILLCGAFNQSADRDKRWM